jgi:hypothetical protein
MDFHLLLHHSVSFVVGAWHVEESLDIERDISWVVDHVFVGYFGVSEVFIELLVFVSGHIAFLSGPESSQRINYLSVEFDREGYELWELFDCLFDQSFLREFATSWQKSQFDPCSSLKIEVVSIRDVVRATAIRNPLNSLFSSLFGEYFNVVRHDKTGIKSNTELSNNVIWRFGTTTFTLILNFFQECLWARACDCSQVIADLLSVHAHTAVENGNRAVFGVGSDADKQIVGTSTINSSRARCDSVPLLFEGIRTVR